MHTPKLGEAHMPAWLQIAGAIAGAILSYYGRYDDTRVRDMIKDVAYDVKLALQLLNEISVQISRLMHEIEQLPEEFRRILYASQLQELNETVLAALARFRQLLRSGSAGDVFQKEVEDIYHRVVDARTKLEVRSYSGELEFAPLAAMISPIAMLLELGLLYRLGKRAKALRTATEKSYADWFAFLLDVSKKNSVAYSVESNSAGLKASDQEIAASYFGPATQNLSNKAAIYCLEHQIGSTDKAGFLSPPTTIAQWLNETWLRIYFTVTLATLTMNGERIFDMAALPSSFGTEQYGHGAASGAWYGAKPAWIIAVDAYDSRDIQRFRGQNTAERFADIVNSKKWREFLAQGLPDASKLLVKNNEIRVHLRFAMDVLRAIEASHGTLNSMHNGIIAAEAAEA